MNGLEITNWVLWFAFLACIWNMSFWHFLLTMLIVAVYGGTERFIGREGKDE